MQQQEQPIRTDQPRPADAEAAAVAVAVAPVILLMDRRSRVVLRRAA